VMKARNGKARFIIPMQISYQTLVMQEIDHEQQPETAD